MSRKKTKRKRKRSSIEIFGFLALAVVVVGVLWLVFSTAPQGATQPRRPAPDFALRDVNGNTFRLSDQQGKVVVLEFMRTTCHYCEDEMSELVAVHNEFGSDITMISVSIDPQGDTDDVLKSYAAQHNAQWIWARDTANVMSEYQVTGTPTIVIIDPNGQIVQTDPQLTSASTLIQQIQAAQH